MSLTDQTTGSLGTESEEEELDSSITQSLQPKSEISASNEFNDGIHHRKETTSRDLEDARLESTVPDHGLYYAVNEMPPWYINLSVGFQHFLAMFVIAASIPYILSPAMCMEDTDPARSNLISTIIFVSGIATLLQSTLGVRLPIIQGGTFSLLVPTFAILSLPEWQCPDKEVIANMTYEDKTELWQTRMREVQGAITVASLFEVATGCFGIIGLLLRFITPLTITATITMIGLSLFQSTGSLAGQHWGLSGATIAMAILFSQYLRKVQIPVPVIQCASKFKPKWTIKRFNIFQMLPLLLTIIFMWTICAILTVTGALAPDSAARTDTKSGIISSSSWFSIPYPGQWGTPTVTASAVIGIISGIIATTIESIGDYYNAARLCGAKPPPSHSLNRGIAMEGFGTFLAGLFGSGNGSTSYSGNIAMIGITKVGSRTVIQAAGAMMIFCGIFTKISAVFLTIPEPIIGGMFCVLFAMIVGTGVSNLQFVDLNSSRNLFILGFTIFFSLVISQWTSAHPNAIQTGSLVVDQLTAVLLRTTMFVAGFCAFILDNTIPGTPEERGLIEWSNSDELSDANQAANDGTIGADDGKDITYDLPFITPWLKRQRWTSYMPFLPSRSNKHSLKKRSHDLK